MICPSEAITDGHGRLQKRFKPKEMPVARVENDLCSGCGLCSSICPFDCIEIIKQEGATDRFGVATVKVARCVACRLCKSMCIKEAINMGERK